MNSLLLSIGVREEFSPGRRNGSERNLTFPGLLTFFRFNASAEPDVLQITNDSWLFSLVFQQTLFIEEKIFCDYYCQGALSLVNGYGKSNLHTIRIITFN